MELFENAVDINWKESLGPCALIVRGLALPQEAAIVHDLQEVLDQAPFRHMITPGGFTMSVAMTNCGLWGWITDSSGYRYDNKDPVSGLVWPAIPESFLQLATDAAEQAGFKNFNPDSCLINRYQPGSKLTLHQDKNEKDFRQPIVSLSLGLPATFVFGGFNRNDKTVRVKLTHGDVVIWGGQDRLRYHGVLPIKQGHHRLLGEYRINVTFRKAR